jgi:hypothetical protein
MIDFPAHAPAPRASNRGTPPMTPRTPIPVSLLVALAALAALSACTTPPLPPPPPPVVALAPAEGVVLRVDAYRVPEGQS